jgi:hypothetical protein
VVVETVKTLAVAAEVLLMELLMLFQEKHYRLLRLAHKGELQVLAQC